MHTAKYLLTGSFHAPKEISYLDAFSLHCYKEKLNSFYIQAVNENLELSFYSELRVKTFWHCPVTACINIVHNMYPELNICLSHLHFEDGIAKQRSICFNNSISYNTHIKNKTDNNMISLLHILKHHH